MSKSYKNIHQLLHDLYFKNIQDISRYADSLHNSARLMLNKTKILGNIDRAKDLKSIIDRNISKNEQDTFTSMDLMLLHNILCDYFEVITDDVMILSTFEIWAKSQLLRKGYIIHNIDKPKNLKKKQKKSPIHIDSLHEYKKEVNDIIFMETTIGIGQLLKNDYLLHFNLDNQLLNGINEVRNRRNLVHFQMGFCWSISNEMLKLIDFLNKAISE